MTDLIFIRKGGRTKMHNPPIKSSTIQDYKQLPQNTRLLVSDIIEKINYMNYFKDPSEDKNILLHGLISRYDIIRRRNINVVNWPKFKNPNKKQTNNGTWTEKSLRNNLRDLHNNLPQKNSLTNFEALPPSERKEKYRDLSDKLFKEMKEKKVGKGIVDIKEHEVYFGQEVENWVNNAKDSKVETKDQKDQTSTLGGDSKAKEEKVETKAKVEAKAKEEKVDKDQTGIKETKNQKDQTGIKETKIVIPKKQASKIDKPSKVVEQNIRDTLAAQNKISNENLDLSKDLAPPPDSKPSDVGVRFLSKQEKLFEQFNFVPKETADENPLLSAEQEIPLYIIPNNQALTSGLTFKQNNVKFIDPFADTSMSVFDYSRDDEKFEPIFGY